jgi:hypothetical protein
MDKSAFMQRVFASRQLIIERLDGFFEHLAAQMPDRADEVRLHLAYYYRGASEVLVQAVRGVGCLTKEAEALTQLDQTQILDLIAVLHAGQIVSNARDYANPVGYGRVFLDGATSMYDKGPDYLEDWIQFLKDNQDPNDKAFGSRLIFRICRGIAAVLGRSEDLSFIIDGVIWAHAWVDASIAARAFVEYAERIECAVKAGSKRSATSISSEDEFIINLDMMRELGVPICREDEYIPVDCPTCGTPFCLHEKMYREWRDKEFENVPCPECSALFEDAAFARVDCAGCGKLSGYMPLSLCFSYRAENGWRCPDCLHREAQSELPLALTPGRDSPATRGPAGCLVLFVLGFGTVLGVMIFL